MSLSSTLAVFAVASLVAGQVRSCSQWLVPGLGFRLYGTCACMCA